MISLKKAQSSAELIVIISAVMFIFIVFLGIIQQNISIKTIEKRNLEVEEIALTAQNELNIAAKATDGYRREFTLPAKIANLNYNLTLVNNNTIYIFTEDNRHALSLPGQNVSGSFSIPGTTNIIEKRNGIIHLNS
jgi:hypothetical protein